LRPAEKRELVAYAHQAHGISVRQACVFFNLAASLYYYQPKPSSDGEVREALRELAETHSGWGFDVPPAEKMPLSMEP
jgi:putative transposase